VTHRALLYTDIVDSTATTQRLGDERAGAVWLEHDRRARDLLREHRGRELGRSDGFLLMFDAPEDAARYALDYHAQIADLGLSARAGLHVGPVTIRQPSVEDVALGARQIEAEGMSLSLAARVMATARGGQTLLTAEARQALSLGALDGPTEVRSHGYFRLKGIDEPVEISELGRLPVCGFEPPGDAEKSYRVVRDGDLWQPVREIPHRLPAERDAFVGRSTDLLQIARQFESGTRLLTLLGTGGTGKTRLAIRYGRRWLGDWPGGVWFCDLSEASTLDGVCYAVSRTLGVRLGAGDPVAQVADAITARGQCLVVLDNFEQLTQHAAATLGQWLDGRDASFLVTSREKLGLPGEVVQPVEPLPLEGPAFDLFVVRARAARADFVLDDAGRASIEQAVRWLDGLPLAIELAAARMTLFSPAQLLERLRDRFQVLAGRRGPDRQATLRAAIDWSWQLLSPAEQAAFAQCSTFEGGFTLAAAEGVLDLTTAADPLPVVDAIQALVDKSLLRRRAVDSDVPRHEIDEPFFGMYVSIHEFARERCREHGAAFQRALEERHGSFSRRSAPRRRSSRWRRTAASRACARCGANWTTSWRRAAAHSGAATWRQRWAAIAPPGRSSRCKVRSAWP
jgi:predicted ATPase/class 3 adenylate cyclase